MMLVFWAQINSIKEIFRTFQTLAWVLLLMDQDNGVEIRLWSCFFLIDCSEIIAKVNTDAFTRCLTNT